MALRSEFVVRLPVQDEPDQEGDVLPESRQTDGKAFSQGGARSLHRFLVVDDSEDIAASTATMLGLQGHAVRAVTHGEDALSAALVFGPDVILLDIGMPGLDGYAVARNLRANSELQGVKIIAVSGYGTDLARQRAKEAGFDHHFTKPLDLKALEALLK